MEIFKNGEKGSSYRLLVCLIAFYLFLFENCKKLPYIPDENATIFIQASPVTIGSDESSTVLLRGEKGNGYPLPDGTIVNLSASRGNIISQVELIDGQGQTSYTPEPGFVGQTEIYAKSGQAVISPEKLTITVTDRDIKKLLILADPPQLPYGGGSSEIEVNAVDENMKAMPGKNVWLETDQGSLNPCGFIQTDSNGRIRSRLSTEKAAKITAKYKDISAEATVSIGDKNIKPTADFSFSPTQPKNGENVYFNASKSGDSDGWIVNYEWDFGDGNSATGLKASHTYTVNRTMKFQVTLRVRDNSGSEDTSVKEVEVTF